MTWRDKVEIGLKQDAPYRKDNLPRTRWSGEDVLRIGVAADDCL
jgi:hypothetical protein